MKKKKSKPYGGWNPKNLKRRLEYLRHKEKLSYRKMGEKLKANYKTVHAWCRNLGVIETKVYNKANPVERIPKGFTKETKRVTLRLPRHIAIQFCGGF